MTWMWLWAVGIQVPLSASSLVADPAESSFDIRDDFTRKAFNEIREGVKVPKWPEPGVLRCSPLAAVAGKQLLSDTKLATREYVTPPLLPFKDKLWCGAVLMCEWDHLRGTVGTSRLLGELRLRLCVAPNSQAAFDYLILECSTSTIMPRSLLIGQFSESNRLADLGTVGFGRMGPKGGRIMFVRDNIAVDILAYDDMASEALPLAKKIDMLILAQPAMSRDEVMARRPRITFARTVRKDDSNGRFTAVEASAPTGHSVIRLLAEVDGRGAMIKDGEVHLGRKVGKTKIKVTAISDELLTASEEMELDIAE